MKPEFKAISWHLAGNRRICVVALDRDRDEAGLRELVGALSVVIDGAEYNCRGVERFAHMPPWRKGEEVGLWVNIDGMFDVVSSR